MFGRFQPSLSQPTEKEQALAYLADCLHLRRDVFHPLVPGVVLAVAHVVVLLLLVVLLLTLRVLRVFLIVQGMPLRICAHDPCRRERGSSTSQHASHEPRLRTLSHPPTFEREVCAGARGWSSHLVVLSVLRIELLVLLVIVLVPLVIALVLLVVVLVLLVVLVVLPQQRAVVVVHLAPELVLPMVQALVHLLQLVLGGE